MLGNRPSTRPADFNCRCSSRLIGCFFLHAVEKHNLMERQLRLLHQQPRVPLIEDASRYGDADLPKVLQIAIRQWKRPSTLGLEHTLDPATLRVDQVQLDHSLGEERVPVEELRRVLFDDRLHATGQELPSIRDENAIRELHDSNARSNAVVLMGDRVVQCLSKHPSVVLRELRRK